MLNGIREFMRFTDACDGRRIVLFGASLFGAGIMRSFFYGPGGASDILYFCDNDEKKWGTVFCGKEVRPPSALKEDKGNVVVVVTSEYYPEIRKQLEQMDIPHVFYGNVFNYKCLQSQGFNELLLSMLSKGAILPSCREEAEYRSIRKQINENYDKIEKVKSLLSDEKSKEIYQSVVDRKRYGFKSFEDICDYGNEQYFDSSIIKLGDNEVFVDVGCCDGATSLMFAKQTNRSFNKIYAFEPEADIFKKAKKLEAVDYMAGRFELFSCGLSNKNETVRFMKMDAANSKICENGDVEIEAKRLDDVVNDAVSFIKIDAEGAELAILQGAENTIKTHKPKLAVCIYHKVEDLWELPLYIKELVPEYRLFVRHYHPSYYETVLYAIIS